MRNDQESLWGDVFEITTEIVRASESGNRNLQVEALARLRILYEERRELGKPVAFLTEALADFTEDPREAIRLYRLAILQVEDQEPTYTMRIWMASRLIEIDDRDAARLALQQGRVEAGEAHDVDAVEKADMLISQLAV